MTDRTGQVSVSCRSALAFAVLCGLLAGCVRTGQSADDPTLPLGFRVPEPGAYRMLDDTDVINPQVEFMTNGSTDSDFFNRIQADAASCMQLRGWTYEPVFLYQFDQPRTVGERREFVARYGYGVFVSPPAPDSSPQDEAIRRNGERFLALSPEDRRRYGLDYDGMVGEGTPTPDSCLGQAQAATGSLMYNLAAMQEVAGMGRAAWATPQGLAVNQAYTRCMSDRGHDVELPGHAHLMAIDLFDAYERGEIGFEEGAAMELEVAMDSFECELDTRLVWYHHMQAEQVRIIVERYPELARD